MDEWNQGAIGSYQLFAAALGNLEWLQFCLNQDHGKIAADDKVGPGVQEQELKSSPPDQELLK